MIAELEILRSNLLPDQAVDAARHFLSDPESQQRLRDSPSLFHLTWGTVSVRRLWKSFHGTKILVCFWRFFIRLTDGPNSASSPYHEFLIGTIGNLTKKDNGIPPNVVSDVIGEIISRHSSLDCLVGHYLKWSSYGDEWTLDQYGDAEKPFKLAAANLIYQRIVGGGSFDPEQLCNHRGLFSASWRSTSRNLFADGVGSLPASGTTMLPDVGQPSLITRITTIRFVWSIVSRHG